MSFLLSKEEEKLWNQIDEFDLEANDDLDSPENLQRMKANEEAMIERFLQGKKYTAESIKDVQTELELELEQVVPTINEIQHTAGSEDLLLHEHMRASTLTGNSLNGHIAEIGIRKFTVELMNCLEELEERDKFSFIQNIKIFIDNEQRNSKNK